MSIAPRQRAKRVSRIARMRKLGPLKPVFRAGFALPWARAGSLRLVLPFTRAWPVIVVMGAFFAVFCVPLVAVSQNFNIPGDAGLFTLAFKLFTGFWMLGWSVGAVILGLIFFVLLLGREVVIARPGLLLIRLDILGLGVGAEYDVTRMRNLRTGMPDEDQGTGWRGPHLAFDYLGVPVEFGSDIGDPQAAEIMTRLRQALVTPIGSEAFPEPPAEPKTPLPTVPIEAESRAQEIASPVAWTSASTLTLIMANLVPLAGVLLFGWSIGEIMILYWAESAIIGLFNLLKLWHIGRFGILLHGPFFLGHYGAFMSIHLLFIYGFFISGLEGGAGMPLAQVGALFMGIWPALLALLISHGTSYRLNFIGRREYEGRTVQQQMREPYTRIFMMQITIIFGGFLALALASAWPALMLLILLKIGVDARAHLGERTVPLQEPPAS